MLNCKGQMDYTGSLETYNLLVRVVSEFSLSTDVSLDTLTNSQLASLQ